MAARSEGLWCLHTPEHEGIVAEVSAVDHTRAVRQSAAPGFSWCPCRPPPPYRAGGPPTSPVSHARPGSCQSHSRAAPTSARLRSLPGKARRRSPPEQSAPGAAAAPPPETPQQGRVVRRSLAGLVPVGVWIVSPYTCSRVGCGVIVNQMMATGGGLSAALRGACTPKPTWRWAPTSIMLVVVGRIRLDHRAHGTPMWHAATGRHALGLHTP